MNEVTFDVFQKVIEAQFKNMSNKQLFIVDFDKKELWENYLNSFPEGTNPIYLKNTEHDCSCCRHFIYDMGGVVTINDNGEYQTIWDIEPTGTFYDKVAEKMSEFIKNQTISTVFYYNDYSCGTFDSVRIIDDNDTVKFNHFYLKLPNRYVRSKDTINRLKQKANESVKMFSRALVELENDAVKTVIELIDQNSIYRGRDYKDILLKFNEAQNEFVNYDFDAVNYGWLTFGQYHESVMRIRNTAIGSLLIDLSNGVELDIAVKAFEYKVAPYNYKRPKALVTKSMIENAEKKVIELGIEPSLYRRHAQLDDITINNVLFANRDMKKSKGIFDQMKDDVATDIKKLSKVEEVSIDTFINDILPKTHNVEMMFEDRHTNNLMNLIAPVNIDSKNILKWNNNFTWSYNGEVTDSIKEKVRQAGGNVNAFMRVSLAWYNTDDLDLHCLEPQNKHISYSDMKSPTSGFLDVDMNAHSVTTKPVENIAWNQKDKLIDGIYKIYVHQYKNRHINNNGFDIEFEFDGEIYTYHSDVSPQNKKQIDVIEFEYSKEKGIRLLPSSKIKKGSIQKEEWDIKTNTFNNVTAIMRSPNYWDDNKVGNEHYFFIIGNCKNSGNARGFYNEFLHQDLNEHRKVFEMLSGKMRVEHSDNQLAGLGFSVTKHDSVLCKIDGAFSRIIRIKF